MSTFKLPSRVMLIVHLCVACAFVAIVSASGCSSGGGNSTTPDGGSVDSSTGSKDGTTGDTSSGSCTTGQTSCSGKCVNTTNDPANCGTCGATCGGGLVCSSGKCSVGCGTGQTLCGTGTCTNTMTDFDNCGACGKACDPGQVCNAGTCSGVCSPPTTSCGGSCVDTQADPNNCGSCGKACGTGLICNGGNCVSSCGNLTSCATEAGTFCTNTNTDNTNCGTCGNVCPSGEVCTQGKCDLTCQAGTVDCNNTCIDPTSDPTYCGATSGCGVGGVGSAGTACGAGQACGGGICSISCPPGQVACNGTCIDPTSNPTYCGATAGCGTGDAGSAGNKCGSGLVCSGGSCQATCGGGLVLCTVNGTPTCVDPTTNPNFCGATKGCGVGDAGTAGSVCAQGNVCSNGTCGITCGTGLVLCNGVCINPQNDPFNCGAILGSNCQGINAGQTCAAGKVCVNGSCALSCISGQVDCMNQCINPLTSNQFCGANVLCTTYTACPSGETCQDGGCVLSCQAGLVNCDGTCIDPTSDPTYCNANASCSNCSKADNSGATPCACASGNVCNGATPPNAACSLSCLGSEVKCGSPATCINPQTDSTYCGATPGGTCSSTSTGTNYEGVNCPQTTSGSSCIGGTCECPTAPGAAGRDAICGGVCTDGLTSPTNCGAAPQGTCSTVGSSNAVGSNAMGVDCESVTPGSSCVSGVCTCPYIPGTTTREPICNGACVDPTTNNKYCGASGTSCTPGAFPAGDCTQISGSTCSGGVCTCPAAQGSTPAEVMCEQTTTPPTYACIDPSTNNTFCNASGTGATACTGGNRGSVCGPLSTCGPNPAHAGQYSCNDSCAPNQLQCDAGAGAPYCASPSDNNNCGGCHNTCGENGALTTCGLDASAGAQPSGYGCNSTCTAGQTSCPAATAPNPTVPYCANLSTDSNNCGTTVAGCGHICPAGTPLCTGGVCSSTCQGVDTACPAATAGPNPTNPYCADEQNDVDNCGACGTTGYGNGTAPGVCKTSASDTTHVCVSSTCCPASATNTEAVCPTAPGPSHCTDNNTDNNNCGSCGNICTGSNKCMGGSCGIHHDGLGQTWQDSTPENTLNQTEAATACATWKAANPTDTGTCLNFACDSSDTSRCYCPTGTEQFAYIDNTITGTDYFWGYAGNITGEVINFTFTPNETCSVVGNWD